MNTSIDAREGEVAVCTGGMGKCVTRKANGDVRSCYGIYSREVRRRRNLCHKKKKKEKKKSLVLLARHQLYILHVIYAMSLH